jgi:hypothetical protein
MIVEFGNRERTVTPTFYLQDNLNRLLLVIDKPVATVVFRFGNLFPHSCMTLNRSTVLGMKASRVSEYTSDKTRRVKEAPARRPPSNLLYFPKPSAPHTPLYRMQPVTPQ